MLNVQGIYESYCAFEFTDITIRSVLSAIGSEMESVEVWKHPLGFYHAELTPFVNVPSSERFRLHMWLDDHGTIDELGDLHEHTWDLTSLVLVGSVIDLNLLAVPTLAGEYLGSRITYGTKNTAKQVGRFDLTVTKSRTVHSGSIYQIPSRTVHLNKIGVVPTVTLVRSVEDNRDAGPLVFTKYSKGQGMATGKRTKLPASYVFDRLAKVLSGYESSTS